MPTKRRRLMRYAGSAAEADAWEMVFKAGYDYFGDLRRFGGIEFDELGRPSRGVIAEAWSRLGARYMATHDSDPDHPPWALREFGPPEARLSVVRDGGR